MAAQLDRDVSRLVRHLATHGSATRAAGIQWFFKEAIEAHGWKTADLRRYAATVYREVADDQPRLLAVARRLFESRVLEEKLLAVLLAQRILSRCGPAEFRCFEAWLRRVSSWADHDALTMYLIGPMMTEKPARTARVFGWATRRDRWHRRASAVSLIDGVRRGLFTAEATDITYGLMGDRDDMVRKGLGWLLREWGKVRPDETVPLLLTLRTALPRLVLRTACERLPARERKEILGTVL